ncbi:hypothetical protein FJ250_06645 [bacterium]|nr:hypothetical protein [bacterium]
MRAPVLARFLVLVVLAAAAAPSAAGVASRFDSGSEGWLAVSYPFRGVGTGVWTTAALPFDGADGLPPGSVRVGDVFAETGITAPAPFLGDKGSYYGGRLDYDIKLRYTDGVTYPAVVLVGTAISVYFDAPSPVVGIWEARTVPLTETGWKVGGTTTPATQAQFRAVLESLQGLHIYTEWHTGADDTNVDNVVLYGDATPVPTAAMPAVLACAPNPFNPSTRLAFSLPAALSVRLTVNDLAGRRVRVLLDGRLDAGDHQVPWDGRGDDGRALPSGAYLARLEAGPATSTARLVLVR